MGFIDFIKGSIKKGKKEYKHAMMLNGYTPIFSQFGDDIYSSDVVQQAINCIVTEMKKLSPKHIRENGDTKVEVTDREINRLLRDPNELMTTSEFIEKIVWQLYLNYNAFIYPTFTYTTDRSGNRRKIYTGFYPLQPKQVDFIQDSSNKIFVEMRFANGYVMEAIPYENLIHIKYKYSVSEYMGGNEAGQPDNEALLKTLNINNTLLESVSNTIKGSYAINGIIKYNTMLDGEKVEKNIAELEEQLQQNKSGLMGLDIKGEYIPITRNLQLVDKSTLEFIDNKILRNFGVPLCILSGDYTKAQYEAFYQKTLEPLIVAFSQAFTKKLFTPIEKSTGNKIVFYPEDLIFLTNEQKIELVKEAGGRGALTNNQILGMFGLPPYEGGDVRYMSLNYVDVNIANQYQLNNAKASNSEDKENDEANNGGETNEQGKENNE